MTTVIKIISAHLRTIGADGLYCADAECGCELGDLIPCGIDPGQCVPGWRGPNLEALGPEDWAMYGSKEAAEAAKKGDPA